MKTVLKMMAAALSLSVVLAGAAPVSAATPCRDAKGKFIKCPKPAPCRDAKGRFTKCDAGAPS
ncbi:hypothetical protein AA103196_2373 [Ameyamaea chiangmaiensis NBRC 103196]|nr:hypothetical protein AA103196_2373 [Ameyamaea chiangmaiensis NBRC 103196]